MADTFFERLSAVAADRGPLCIGLDPSPGLLAHWGLDDDARGVEALSRTTIEAVAAVAGVVKPQVAFFERHGSAGFAVLERVIDAARAAGLLVIGDAKRGDIPTTNEGYADAWLRDDSPLCVDAMTVSCYLGAAALAPVFSLAHSTGRGVFAVVASSNDEGRAVQTALDVEGRAVESALLCELGGDHARAGRRRSAVAVPRRGGRCPAAPRGLEHFEGPVLVTGMGAQGSDASDVASLRALAVPRGARGQRRSRASSSPDRPPTRSRRPRRGSPTSSGDPAVRFCDRW